MEIINDILKIREEKSNLINKYINDYQIITLKANVVGINKNIKEAYILLSYFDKLLSEYCLKKITISDADGPYVLYLSNEKNSLKERMIQIEESNPLGRFVDIDVYYKNHTSISRGTLRKCYLCDNPAFVCGRLKPHTTSELNDFLKSNTIDYCSNLVTNLCKDSMLEELNIHPKFGLVTPFSNGSHSDMNYEIMTEAINVIIPYFKLMFVEGINCEDYKKTFNNIREIGIAAEQAMLLKTNNVNAYKGLIFALGLIVCSLGIKLSNLKSAYDIFDYVKIMVNGITKEIESCDDSNGIIAFKNHQIKGARHQAESGYIDVVRIISKYSLDSYESKLMALCELISLVDDTVLYKRCNDITKYYKVKEMFKMSEYDKERINELNKYCLENNLSFGGSADLLVVSIFIKKVYGLFNLDLFEKFLHDEK